MFLWSILLVLSIPPLAEACVPTVPPEEYFPTSPLPESSTGPFQVTTTVDQMEMTTTAGGGGATVASTTAAEENKCATCDFEDIDVTITGENVITQTDDDPPTDDGCKVIYFFCGRNDGASCTTVELRATNPSSSMLLTGDITPGSIALSFTCGDDGRYGTESFTGITALSCVATGCTTAGK